MWLGAITYSIVPVGKKKKKKGERPSGLRPIRLHQVPPSCLRRDQWVGLVGFGPVGRLLGVLGCPVEQCLRVTRHVTDSRVKVTPASLFPYFAKTLGVFSACAKSTPLQQKQTNKKRTNKQKTNKQINTPNKQTNKQTNQPTNQQQKTAKVFQTTVIRSVYCIDGSVFLVVGVLAWYGES